VRALPPRTDAFDESDKSCSHESPYPSRTGAAPESPLFAMRPLHAVMRKFPPADIFTAQALQTADPQISCVCAQCARRAAAQVAPDTGPSAHAHSPGSREWSTHTQKSQLPCTRSHTGGCHPATPDPVLYRSCTPDPVLYRSLLLLTPCTPVLYRRYRAIVGALGWLNQGTRPDISHAYSEMSKFVQRPGQKHMDAA